MGCAMVPIAAQHPAWQCDASYAAPLGAALASLITADPSGLVAATSIAVNLCKAEASLAAGPPAQHTTTTITTAATTQSPP
jgi:kynureninase